jgi:hypothetical protein
MAYLTKRQCLIIGALYGFFMGTCIGSMVVFHIYAYL